MSKINAKLLAEAISLIIQAVGGGSADNDSADEGDTEEKTEKRGRGRPAGSTKTKPAETKTASNKKSSKKDEDEDDGLGDDEEEDDGLGLDEEEEEVTQEDVVNAFKALKASKGIEKCREVLAKLDESNVLNIPAKKYADALKEINRAASKK